MRCEFCSTPFVPGRLFCTHCGDVTPEGKRVMSGQSSTATETFRVPAMAAALPLAPAMPTYRVRRATETSSAAVLSLVFGLLSYIFLPFVGALLAIATGHFAKREIKVSGGRVDGDLIATTGLVLGYSQIVLASLALVFLFVVSVVAIVAG